MNGLAALCAMKQGRFGEKCLTGEGFDLLPFTADLATPSSEAVHLLARWRRENEHGFPIQGNDITPEGTAVWAQAQLVASQDSILFFIRDGQGRLVGHIGLTSCDFAAQECEFYNIVRGEGAAKGLLTAASVRLLDWSEDALGMRSTWLKVFYDNLRAVALYHRLGFRPTALFPLRRVEEGPVVRWLDADGPHIDRFFLKMVRPKPEGGRERPHAQA